MNIKEKHKLRKFIKELEAVKGRHTELVSVYVPAGYDIIKIIQHLEQESGTASNIKDARTRKNVIDSLERAIRHLRLFKRTPENGLAVFAGNASESENKIDIKVWSIEPTEPLNFRLYRCDQNFMLAPLKEMLEHKEVYGLIVLDKREGNIGLLKGHSITELRELTSGVPGKFKTGGQCHSFGVLVQCSDGTIIKIENSHNPLQVKSMDISTRSLKDSPIIDKWYVNKNRVYRIITKYPQLVVECSADHLFFVNTQDGIVEKTASELKKNDQLLMPEKIKINGSKQSLEYKKYYNSFIISQEGMKLIKNKRLESKLYQRELARKIDVTQTTISSYEIGKLHADREQLRKVCDALGLDFYHFILKYTKPYKHCEVELPEFVDKNIAQFVGYLIGDGCIEKDRITFFEQTKQVALDYKKKFSDYFNLVLSYKFRESKNYHQIKFTSRPIVRLILNEFPEVKRAFDTEVPLKIMKSGEEVVGSFLKGYFDAEGYVNPNQSIGIASIYKTLIQQVQMLLLRFSIISSFFVYDNKRNPYSKKPIYKLQINEKASIVNFKKFIGFTSIEKMDKLNKLIEIKSEKSSVRQVLNFGAEIKKLICQNGLKITDFPITSFFQNKRMMSKFVFKKSILSLVKNRELYNELKKIYDCELLPVAIHRIEVEEKKTQMVDISVQNQAFIANGILSHNSAQRFERIREGMAKEFFVRIGEAANVIFLEMKENLKGIIIGGPGPTKEEFLAGHYLNNELKRKVIGVKDLSYTGEFGLNELVDKSHDLLAKEEIIEEKKILTRFFEMLGKEPGKVSYGKIEVNKVLEMAAVDKLLLSESLGDEEIEKWEEKAEKYGTEVVLISTETREGVQLRDLGGIAAILRYEIR